MTVFALLCLLVGLYVPTYVRSHKELTTLQRICAILAVTVGLVFSLVYAGVLAYLAARASRPFFATVCVLAVFAYHALLRSAWHVRPFYLRRERARVLARGPVWALSAGGYLYLSDTLLGLIKTVVREWESDKHLVG